MYSVVMVIVFIVYSIFLPTRYRIMPAASKLREIRSRIPPNGSRWISSSREKINLKFSLYQLIGFAALIGTVDVPMAYANTMPVNTPPKIRRIFASIRTSGPFLIYSALFSRTGSTI